MEQIVSQLVLHQHSLLLSVPQSFQIFVAQDFLSHYSGLHTVDAPYRAFDDIILVLKPREEA